MIQFSIIIPTCNRNDSLALCLDRLQPGTQSLNADHYEVIVSDDGQDNEAKMLIQHQYPWVHWVEGPKKGPAANRNNGARLAKGVWLVFTDDDCLPDAHWLSEYAKAVTAYPDSKAFEGAILPDDWDLLKKDMAECPVNTEGGCFWSANIVVEKKLFDEIGGFDEKLIIAANEDQDLYRHLCQYTGVLFWENAYVVHPVRFASFRKKVSSIPKVVLNWRKYYRKGHNLSNTIFKAISSQFLAMLSTIKYRKAKSFVYHFICLFTVIPLILVAECRK